MESILLYDANIRELAETLHLGPQAEVLDLIENFNQKYISNSNDIYSLRRMAPMGTKPLGITKKFSWKPGAYDTMKAILNGCQSFNMRAQSLGRIIERVRGDGVWRIRSLDSELNAIERILLSMRYNGIVMQDNSDEAVEAYEIIKNHFIEQYQNSNGAFDVRIASVSNDDRTISDYNIWVVYKYDEPTIEFKHTGETTNKIGEVKFRGTVIIKVRYSVSRLINVLISQGLDISKLNSNKVKNMHDHGPKNGAYLTGGYTINNYALQHPYISRDNHSYGRRGRDSDFRYVCFGNLLPEVEACLGSLDLISAKIFIDRLVTHYDTQTGPLNRLPYSYHGIPEELDGNEEYESIIPLNVSGDCSYYYILQDMPQDLIKTDSYCVNYCSFKNNCHAYKEFSKELSNEEKERAALEQATINAARRI